MITQALCLGVVALSACVGGCASSTVGGGGTGGAPAATFVFSSARAGPPSAVFQSTTSPDGSALSVLFDDASAHATPARRRDERFINIRVPVTVSGPGLVTAEAQVRGSVIAPTCAEAELWTLSPRVMLLKRWRGEQGPFDLTVRCSADPVGASEVVSAGPAPTREFGLVLLLRSASGALCDAEGLIQVDSVDVKPLP
ncbi:MAG: hypothetical protein JNK25_15570 [Phycisphaerae bacterium]|nr:hypothetical protein [Phycisphaerae bacterium]